MRMIVGADDSYDEINKRRYKGYKVWRKADGKLHRDGDLPAVIRPNGTISYYKDGKCHRDGDLPARIHASGFVEYWIDGVWQK